ncbi:MAG: HEAT repeat domain-containing protein [Candidatus Wallbacteria bacterium]|nr:HEAT repeat domain-containing protein [Candidatus Wallbacteria bacterium]
MNLEQLKKELSNPDPNVRVGVINNLLKIDFPQKTELLMWIAQNDVHPQIRAQARKIVDALQQKNAPQKQHTFCSTPEPEATLLKGTAGEKLWILKLFQEGKVQISKQMIRELIPLEPDPLILSALLKALGQFGDDTDFLLITKGLEHENSRVRANAIEALKPLSSSLTYDYVLPLLSDPDARVRANAVLFLFSKDEGKTFAVLEEMAHSDVINELESVIFTLEQIDDISVNDLLIYAEARLVDLKRSASADHAFKSSEIRKVKVAESDSADQPPSQDIPSAIERSQLPPEQSSKLLPEEIVLYFGCLDPDGGESSADTAARQWILVTDQRILFEALARVGSSNKEKFFQQPGSIQIAKVSYVGIPTSEVEEGCPQVGAAILLINSRGGQIALTIPTMEEAGCIQKVINGIISRR